MKIGLVIYGSLDTLSGGYLYDRKLVEYLRQAGDTVELVSMPWKNYLRHLNYNIEPPWARRLARLDVDVLLQDELNHPSLFIVNRAIRDSVSYPIISIVHHLRSSEDHPRPFLAFYRQVERRFLHSVDGFIWNSQTTRTVVEKMIGNTCRGVVAYPAGDRLGGLSEFEIIERCSQPRPLRLLFVGNLIPRKGLHHLVSALEILKGLPWTLTVAGDPQVDPNYVRKVYRQVQQSGLGDQIQFLGRLADDRLAQEWRCGQLFVLPSLYEGFGIVYLEGMSFGLPSIASNAGAAGEIIENGVNGERINPVDSLQLASAIRSFLDRPQRLLAASLAARTSFETFPTWEQSAQKVRQFLLDFRAQFKVNTG